MSALDTDAIRSRVAKASPGPWRLDKPRPDGRNAVARDGYDLYGGEVSEWIIFDTNPEDAEFIAHAREDIPALLAEIDRLHAALRKTPSFANREKSAVFAWKAFIGVEGVEMSHNFRSGYHRGAIDFATKQEPTHDL